jgi:NAD(P)-dependent dehydrogenase (short-subunit alcohol dehydrogenase family)
MKGWVLVTGAAKRIGRVIALEMAHAGWDVAVHYHTSQREAEETATDIRTLGRKVCLVELDLADAALVRKVIPALGAELGPLAALVNSASLFLPDTLDPGDHQKKINLEAPRILSEIFFRQSPRDKSGAIVNLLDTDPTTTGFSFYNRSKKMLAAMTLRMAKHFAPTVRVNGVAPGPVLPSPRQSLEHFNDLVRKTPLGKPLTPESIAASVRFLIENAAVTGAIIPVDGGAHLKNRKS